MPPELKLILEFDENSNSDQPSASEEINGIQLLSGYGNESDTETEEKQQSM